MTVVVRIALPDEDEAIAELTLAAHSGYPETVDDPDRTPERDWEHEPGPNLSCFEMDL